MSPIYTRFPILFLLFISTESFSGLNAQTVYPGWRDGVVYCKISDTSSITINYSNPSPEIATIISTYQVSDIRKAFFTPDASLQKIYRVTFSDITAVNALISDLAAISYIEYAEKAPLYSVSYTPDDFSSTVQWGLAKIDASDAWGVTTGSASVKIAIVDNAVDYMHEDLLPNAWTNPGEIPGNGIDDDLDGYTDDVHGYDVADNDNDPRPPSSITNSSVFIHGTHCAGIASAATDNGIGIASLGFKAKIISVKCSPDNSDGSALTNAYEGVDYAISAGANIISMSFGSTNTTVTWQYIVNAADVRNIILVAAAGNDNSNTAFYPAAYSSVIAVGATEPNDTKSSYSNYGSWVDVMAPGSGIYSTLPQGNNTYGSLSGTSMACPLVAGLSAMVLSVFPGLSPSQMDYQLKSGCDNIDAENPSYAGQLGAGRINAFKSLGALGYVQPIVDINPLFTIYPNPCDGNCRITTAKTFDDPVEADIFSVNGKKVASRMIYGLRPGTAYELLLSEGLDDGEYILEFSSGGNFVGQQKLVLLKKSTQ